MVLNEKFCCYEVSLDCIKDVAERNKLSLKGVDLEDIIYYVKKGVDAAIGDVREQIMREAIRASGAEKIDLEE